MQKEYKFKCSDIGQKEFANDGECTLDWELDLSTLGGLPSGITYLKFVIVLGWNHWDIDNDQMEMLVRPLVARCLVFMETKDSEHRDFGNSTDCKISPDTFPSIETFGITETTTIGEIYALFFGKHEAAVVEEPLTELSQCLDDVIKDTLVTFTYNDDASDTGVPFHAEVTFPGAHKAWVVPLIEH